MRRSAIETRQRSTDFPRARDLSLASPTEYAAVDSASSGRNGEVRSHAVKKSMNVWVVSIDYAVW